MPLAVGLETQRSQPRLVAPAVGAFDDNAERFPLARIFRLDCEP
jgi:hypothetical protein